MQSADFDLETRTEEEDAESFLTEEERAAIEAQEDAFDQEDEERQMSAFSRGCLEVAGFFAILAALIFFLEHGGGICIGYMLPQLFVPLCCVAASMLALTTCLFSMLRKGLAAVVLIVTVWFLVLLYGVTNYQFPEVIPTSLPHTEEPVLLTQITTPIAVNLCVDEELIPGVVSRRFKVPVHPRYVPLNYQVSMVWSEEHERVLLYYNEKLWAVYDPGKSRWTDTLHSGISPEEDTGQEQTTAATTQNRKATTTTATRKKTQTTTTAKKYQTGTETKKQES